MCSFQTEFEVLMSRLARLLQRKDLSEYERNRYQKDLDQFLEKHGELFALKRVC